MGTHIRPATEHDYATLATLWNERFPALTFTAETLRLEDRHRSSDLECTRLLVEQDGIPRAFGGATQRAGDPDLREFTIEIAANAAARTDGLDDLLYESLLTWLAPRSPHRLFAWTREDDEAALHFWRARGFQIAQRSYESVLELASLDWRDLDALQADAKERLPGLVLESLGAWLARADAASVQRDLYELHVAVDADVPIVGTFTPPPFREFVQRHFEDPRLAADLFTVAMVADGPSLRPIALSELWKHHEEGRLQTGLTGVLRGYRNRGVASAVKARGLAAARAAGFARVHTWNAAENRGMRTINERFGFVPQPVMFDLTKDWSGGAP